MCLKAFGYPSSRMVRTRAPIMSRSLRSLSIPCQSPKREAMPAGADAAPGPKSRVTSGYESQTLRFARRLIPFYPG
jgi:hypothetical protein